MALYTAKRERENDDEFDDEWAKHRIRYPWSTPVLVPRNDEATDMNR